MQRKVLLAILFALFAPGAQAQNAEGLFATGALPERPDALRAATRAPRFRSFLPEAVDLSPRMPPVGNQGPMGSCVGWAVGYAARSYYSLASDGDDVTQAQNQASPGYVYHSIRPGGCDRGSFLSDALDLLSGRGAVSEADFPYDGTTCAPVPDAIRSKATDFRISDWVLLDHDDLEQIKGAIAQGHPVIVSAGVDRAFHRLRSGQTWTSTDDFSDEDGFHAMVVTGYDDREATFTLMNSWGTRWGTEGFTTVTYAAFDKRVRRAYQIIPVTAPVPPYREPEPGPQPKQEDVILPNLQCASLQEVAVGGDIKAIKGFVGSEKDLRKVQETFAGSHTLDVRLRPWPQCEALLIGTSRGEPLNGKNSATLRISGEKLIEGELLAITADFPAFSGYLHLAYFQADGSVVHLSQAAGRTLSTRIPGEQVIYGDGQDGRARFKVSAPFGAEMLLAIVTRAPLFAAPRPQGESERDFLTALRAATIDFQENGGRFFAMSELPVQTAPNGGTPKWLPPEYGPQSPRQ